MIRTCPRSTLRRRRLRPYGSDDSYDGRAALQLRPRKTALVTGGSRGIGCSAALALAKAGAQVLVHHGRAEAEAASLFAEIEASGGRADKIGVDLQEPQGAHTLAEHARSIVGERLDILVANAGIATAATIEKKTVANFDVHFAVNVRTPFFLVQQLLPILGSGCSISFTSP
jgi:3-oxoacyl-[acyl-carrier protein] reductase